MNAFRLEDEDEAWDDEDTDGGDDSDDEPTVPCPYCRCGILEDSPRCPYCERYIAAEDHADQKKPVWIIATTLVCLGVTVWWLFKAF